MLNNDLKLCWEFLANRFDRIIVSNDRWAEMYGQHWTTHSKRYTQLEQDYFRLSIKSCSIFANIVLARILNLKYAPINGCKNYL